MPDVERWLAPDGVLAEIPLDGQDANGCILITADQVRRLLRAAGFQPVPGRHSPTVRTLPDSQLRPE